MTCMILVFLGKKKDHIDQLQNNLEECHINDISLHPKKCTFYVTSRVLLGHIVYNKGLLVDQRKIDIITKMPTPKNVTKIK